MAERSSSATTIQQRSVNHSTRILSASSSTAPIKDYPSQTSIGIFYHDKEIPGNILRQIKFHLNRTFTYSQVFNERLKFTNYLSGELIAKKIIFIIYSKFAESLSSLATERSQCHNIYILRVNHQLSVQPSLTDHANVVNYLKEEFEKISMDIQKDEYLVDNQSGSFDNLANEMTVESASLSIFNSNPSERSFQFLSSESLTYLLHQTYAEVLINMKHEQKALDEMLHWCRICYEDDKVVMTKIGDFKKTYNSTKAICYYTQDSFVFREVNKVFRLEDLERIYTFRVYITHLCQQILNCAQSSPVPQSNITLYRGKKLSNIVLQKLLDNLNKPISINGFLSTTKNIEIAKTFSGVDQAREGYESAIFKLCICTSEKMRCSFADIEKHSMMRSEAEVLFSMGSVWLLKKMEWTGDYWLIELQSCNSFDCQLDQLEVLANNRNFLTMGHIARALGKYSSAKNFYRRMLDAHQNDRKTRGLVYYHMGLLADELDEYMDALQNFLKAEELMSITTAENDPQSSSSQPLYSCSQLPSRLNILNNIARSFERKGDYENARENYTKALDERGDLYEKTTLFYNLGLLEYREENYEEAREYFIKVIEAGNDHKTMQDSQKKLRIINAMLSQEAASSDN